MFELAVNYLKENGWTDWNVVQLGVGVGVVWLFFRPGEDSPSIVGKLLADFPSNCGTPRECAILERLSPFAESLHIPQLLMQRRTEHSFLYLQTAMPGHPLADELDPTDDKAIAQQLALVEPWLEIFQTTVPVEGDLAGCLDRTQWESSAFPDPLRPGAAAAQPRLRGIPASPVHGDFWGRNVLQGTDSIAVIDWEGFHEGAPLEDLFTFCVSTAIRVNLPPPESADFIWNVFFGRSPLALRTQEATMRTLARLNLPPELLQPLFLQFISARCMRTEFLDNSAWRLVAARYAEAGTPMPWPMP